MPQTKPERKEKPFGRGFAIFISSSIQALLIKALYLMMYGAHTPSEYGVLQLILYEVSLAPAVRIL